MPPFAEGRSSVEGLIAEYNKSDSIQECCCGDKCGASMQSSIVVQEPSSSIKCQGKSVVFSSSRWPNVTFYKKGVWLTWILRGHHIRTSLETTDSYTTGAVTVKAQLSHHFWEEQELCQSLKAALDR